MSRLAEFPEPQSIPVFLEKADKLRAFLRSLPFADLKALLGCNDKIAALNFERYRSMDLSDPLKNGNAAILSYDGIQYKYMAPQVFEERYFGWVQKHVRILSGFYGILRPLDGIVPYRLEMQAKLRTDFCRDLYDFWGSSLCSALLSDEGGETSGGRPLIINLASAEYSRAVERYLPANALYLTCLFGELENGKLREKGVYVKMARGEMVRYLAENSVDGTDETALRESLSAFNRLGFRFYPALSGEKTLAFVMDKKPAPSAIF